MIILTLLLSIQAIALQSAERKLTAEEIELLDKLEQNYQTFQKLTEYGSYEFVMENEEHMDVRDYSRYWKNISAGSFSWIGKEKVRYIYQIDFYESLPTHKNRDFLHQEQMMLINYEWRYNYRPDMNTFYKMNLPLDFSGTTVHMGLSDNKFHPGLWLERMINFNEWKTFKQDFQKNLSYQLLTKEDGGYWIIISRTFRDHVNFRCFETDAKLNHNIVRVLTGSDPLKDEPNKFNMTINYEKIDNDRYVPKELFYYVPCPSPDEKYPNQSFRLKISNWNLEKPEDSAFHEQSFDVHPEIQVYFQKENKWTNFADEMKMLKGMNEKAKNDKSIN